MKYLISILCCLSILKLIGQEEQLIIFTQASDELFIQETLSKINTFAKDEDIKVFQFNAQEGLPETLTSTPAILYRNGNGTSTYAGRYTSLSTIKNFIRSARVISQDASTLNKENSYVSQEGKMKIAAAIKITDLQFLDSSVKASMNLIEFNQSAHKGIQKGLEEFSFQNIVELQRTDRIFYLDYHPYFVSSDSLILSMELYSQFSCIDPIYISINSTNTGSDITDVFQRATMVLKKEILQSLQSSKIGDAYSSVAANQKVKELNEFGVPVPVQGSTTYSPVDPNRRFPKEWIFKSSVNDKLPILQFNFIEPLTRYAGEIKSIDGTLKLNQTNQLAEGLFEAAMKSLTMGEESFDKKVLKEYVKARSNPKSQFSITQLINVEPLAWLQTSTLTFIGDMNLMKRNRPITVTANITPYVDDSDNELLLIQANWSMNITDGWNIKGPDGPNPAKKTLEFSMNVLMQPIK